MQSWHLTKYNNMIDFIICSKSDTNVQYVANLHVTDMLITHVLLHRGTHMFQIIEICSLEACIITMASCALHRLAATGLFVQQIVYANKKENVKVLHHWSFVSGIHRWPVDSPHKGPVMQKPFPRHDIMINPWIVCIAAVTYLHNLMQICWARTWSVIGT